MSNLLDTAIDSLVIRDVSLRSSDIAIKEGFFPEFRKEPLLIQFQNSIQGSSLSEIKDDENYKSILVYHYNVAFRALPQELPEDVMKNEELLKGEILAEVKATFNASYYVKETLEDEAMKAFGFANIGFHVWPYWREYASSVATRLRLPHFIVPMKRMQDIQQEIE